MIKLSSFATWMAEKVAPQLARFAENPANPLTHIMTGAAVGGATGALAGSATDQNNKKRGAIIGGLTGAITGGLGGKYISNFAKGGVDAEKLKGLSSTMKSLGTNEVSTKQYLGGLTRQIASWGTPNSMAKVVAQENVTGKQVRPLLGFLKQSPIATAPAEHAKWSVTRPLGNLAQTVLGIRGGGYGLTAPTMPGRVWEGLKNEVSNSQYFIRDGLRYKRSLAGKGLAAVGTTGIGMGGLTAVSARKKNGQPEPLPEKIMKGTASAVSWGLAPQVMGAKAVAYDIPRQALKENRGS